MEEDDDAEDFDRGIQAAHAALVEAGEIEPLSRDEGETRFWLDCELCSLVENRFFEPVDPLAMTPEVRDRWEPRASSDEPLSSPHGHRWYRRVYWMREGGERAGTVAFSVAPMGLGLVTVSSLYTIPSFRKRGIAGRVLRRAQEAVVAHGGRGLRVPAYWTWQPAVRFYLGLGMWVSNWKHSLVFTWQRGLPGCHFEIGDRDARFSIVQGGVAEPVIEAERAGDRLVWRELPRLDELHREESWYHAKETFAVALATRGWPLIRSDEAWENRWSSSDCGRPEGLACKIEIWEGWEKKSGYLVRAPRIPGIAYRDWDDIK